MRTPSVLLVAVAVASLGTYPGCRSDGRPRPIHTEHGAHVALWTLPFAELTVPKNSRPDGAAPSRVIPIVGPFEPDGTTRKGGMTRFRAPLPVRPRSMFFARPQGVELHDKTGAPVTYDKSGRAE